MTPGIILNRRGMDYDDMVDRDTGHGTEQRGKTTTT